MTIAANTGPNEFRSMEKNICSYSRSSMHNPAASAALPFGSRACAALQARWRSARSVLIASQAFAGGTEQLKAFVAQVHAARGTFVQQEVTRAGQGARASGASAGAAQPCSPPRAAARTARRVARSRSRGRASSSGQYEKPYAQVLQADGDKLYVYDKDLNQGHSAQAWAARSARARRRSCSAATIWRRTSRCAMRAERPASTGWNSRRRRRTRSSRRVGIGFKNGNLQAMELHDVFGNVTLADVLEHPEEPAAQGDQFKFSVPKGADVINGQIAAARSSCTFNVDEESRAECRPVFLSPMQNGPRYFSASIACACLHVLGETLRQYPFDAAMRA